MIYVAEAVTPPNTFESSPLITRMKVTKGLVYKIWVYIPNGALAMHHIQVYDGSFQAWPSTPGSAFRGDGVIIEFDDTYMKFEAPFEFQIKTWNLDNTYHHLVIVQIGMVSQDIFMARFLPSMTYDKMLEVLSETAKAQAAEREAIIAQPFTWLAPSEQE